MRRTLVLATLVLVLSWSSAATAQRMSGCGVYSYVKGASEGRYCATTSQAPPPQRVTAICRDRSVSYDWGSAACFEHGGVQTWKH